MTRQLPTTCATQGVRTPALTPAQRLAIIEYVQELTAEGRHLEASTLYAEYFPYA